MPKASTQGVLLVSVLSLVVACAAFWFYEVEFCCEMSWGTSLARSMSVACDAGSGCVRVWLGCKDLRIHIVFVKSDGVTKYYQNGALLAEGSFAVDLQLSLIHI